MKFKMRQLGLGVKSFLKTESTNFQPNSRCHFAKVTQWSQVHQKTKRCQWLCVVVKKRLFDWGVDDNLRHLIYIICTLHAMAWTYVATHKAKNSSKQICQMNVFGEPSPAKHHISLNPLCLRWWPTFFVATVLTSTAWNDGRQGWQVWVGLAYRKFSLPGETFVTSGLCLQHYLV